MQLPRSIPKIHVNILNIPIKNLTGGETSSASNSYEYKHISLNSRVLGNKTFFSHQQEKHMVLKRSSFQNICRESNDKLQPSLPQNMAFNSQNSVFSKYHKKKCMNTMMQLYVPVRITRDGSDRPLSPYKVHKCICMHVN